eukprot:768584-Hanusia_phi.AAC.1
MKRLRTQREVRGRRKRDSSIKKLSWNASFCMKEGVSEQKAHASEQKAAWKRSGKGGRGQRAPTRVG